MQRPVRFRLIVGLAGLAGLAAAWLLPRVGGETPAITTTPPPSDRPGVTAVSVPLDQITEGVSYRPVEGVRVFLVRTGTTIVGLFGRVPGTGSTPIHWCQKNGWFEAEGSDARWAHDGTVARYSFPTNVERVRVLVTGGTATIFPQDVTPPTAAPPTPSGIRLAAPPPACSPDERLG